MREQSASFAERVWKPRRENGNGRSNCDESPPSIFISSGKLLRRDVGGPRSCARYRRGERGARGAAVLDSLDSEELEKAIIEAEKQSRLKKQQSSLQKAEHSPSTFETPDKQPDVDLEILNSDGTGSSSGPLQHVRRVIVPPAHLKSYVDEGSKKQFSCSTEVNKLYALVLLHGRKFTRARQITYDRYFLFPTTTIFVA